MQAKRIVCFTAAEARVNICSVKLRPLWLQLLSVLRRCFRFCLLLMITPPWLCGFLCWFLVMLSVLCVMFSFAIISFQKKSGIKNYKHKTSILYLSYSLQKSNIRMTKLYN